MTLLLALTSGAAPAAIDLLCPTLDDGRSRRKHADRGWHPGFLQVDAVADLLAPATQDAPRRKRRADAWQSFLAPDVDLFAPVLDDGATRARWADDFITSQPDVPPAAPADLLGGVLDDGFRRVRRVDEFVAAGLDAPVAAADMFAGMLDDGAAAARRWAEEFATGTLPQDAPAVADLFAAVLDDGFIRRRPTDALHAYLPPDIEAPAPPPAPVTAPSSGGHARKTTRAYDRNQQIKRQNEAILAVVIAAVTSGALE